MTRIDLCSSLFLVPFLCVSLVPGEDNWAHATGLDLHLLTNVSKDILDVSLSPTFGQIVPRDMWNRCFQTSDRAAPEWSSRAKPGHTNTFSLKTTLKQPQSKLCAESI